MQTGSMVLLLCLGGFLVGCSSKPDVGDIEPELNKSWEVCQGLKMVDLKKTNGIDRGDTYEIAVSYKLEITKDVTGEEAWYSEAICPAPGTLQLLWVYGRLDQKFGYPLNAGDFINVNSTFTMVKSEKGWVIQ